MDQSRILYVGLDVHKDSIDIALAESPRDAEVRHLATVAGGTASVTKAIAAMTLVAEIQDFWRFASPRQLMAYLGLVPCEDSSGPRRRLGEPPRFSRRLNTLRGLSHE